MSASKYGRNRQPNRFESFEPFTLLTHGAAIEFNHVSKGPEYNDAAVRFRGFLANTLLPGKPLTDALKDHSFAKTCSFLIHLANGTGSPGVKRAVIEMTDIFTGIPKQGVTFSDPSRITPDFLGMNITGLGFGAAHYLHDLGKTLTTTQSVQNTNINTDGYRRYIDNGME